MARKEYVIGAPDNSSSFSILWSTNVLGEPILSAFLADRTHTLYLTWLNIRSVSSSQNVYIALKGQPSYDNVGGVDELSDALEQHSQSFTFRAGDLTLVLPGPTNSAVISADTTAPYSYRVNEAKNQEIGTFISSYQNLTASQKAQTRLIIDDGRAPLVKLSVKKSTFRPLSSSVALARIEPVISTSLYSLDADADTTPLPAGSPGLKIVLEIGRFLGNFRMELEPGLETRPLLRGPSVIEEETGLGVPVSQITFALDNQRGEFADDLVGAHIQLWSLSLGRSERLYLGQITGQRVNALEAVFTASALPVDSLSTEIPRRVIDDVSFPFARAKGTPVPVVFGRVVRHRCPHIGSGIVSETVYPAAAGDSAITVADPRGMHAGQVLVLDVGAAAAEEIRVKRIENLQITLAGPLSHPHPASAGVATIGVQHDYLLGEGAWHAGNFEEVYRVYHNGRALPEFICPEHREPATLLAGRQNFALDPKHRVQLDDWYRNYYIQFLSKNGDVVGSAVVEAYSSEKNEVSINLDQEAAGYTCYSMKEYIFYDGSQASPYPGFAFIRLVRNYTGEIHADVRGFNMPSTVDVIQECLRNPDWGAGEKRQISFRNSIDPRFRFEGPVNSRRRLVDLLSHLSLFRRFKVVIDRYSLIVEFEEDSNAITMPDDESLYISPPVIAKGSLEDRNNTVLVRYGVDQKKNELLYEISENLPHFLQKDHLVEAPYVYDSLTADMVLSAAAARELSKQEIVSLVIDPRQVGSLRVGQKITIPKELLPGTETDTNWIIDRVAHTADVSLAVEAKIFVPEIYTYPNDRSPDLFDDSDSHVETDFSQTPPEPLRNLLAETEEKSIGRESVFNCVVKFTPPRENYGGAEIWFALADEELSLVTEEDPGNPGTARFDLPADLRQYRVVGYSLSADRQRRGYPVEFTVNRSPMADAGADKNAYTSSNVSLDGSGSTDPDGDALSYSWRQLSGTPVTLRDADKVKASFTTPSTTGRLEFELTVSDGHRAAADSVVITVQASTYVPPTSNPNRPAPTVPPWVSDPVRIVSNPDRVSTGTHLGYAYSSVYSSVRVTGTPPPGWSVITHGTAWQTCTTWLSGPHAGTTVCSPPITLSFAFIK